MASKETSYTLTDAAAVTGRSRVTIRRYLDAGKFPNAWRDEADGDSPAPWRVPLGDLLSAGMSVHPADRLPARALTHPDTPPLSRGIENDSVSRLREELAVTSALAHERARTIEVLVAQLTDLRSLLADSLATTRTLAAVVAPKEV